MRDILSIIKLGNSHIKEPPCVIYIYKIKKGKCNDNKKEKEEGK